MLRLSSMKILTLAIATLAAALPAAAQNGTLNCEHVGHHNGNITHCQMKEQTIPFSGSLAVNAEPNGGVSVKGWDKNEVLVRARMEASGADDAAAQAALAQIRLNVSAGQVSATGPQENWQVSYEIFLPRQANLNVKAKNGGVHISDVRGNIQFATKNGGVTLDRVAGDVEGSTTNGGLKIELAGSRWDGAKLDARTVNGGIQVTMPDNYSAHLEAATVNGGLHIGNQTRARGEAGRSVVTDVGSGGATIHLETKNGGVNVTRM